MGIKVMRALVIATTIVAAAAAFAPQAQATPSFQLQITSAGYASPIFSSGTGSISESGITVNGTGGSQFSIGSISANWSLASDGIHLNTMDLLGSITHTSGALGSLQIKLKVSGLDDPGAPAYFTEAFTGNLAAGLFSSDQWATNATAIVYLGKPQYLQMDDLFHVGAVRLDDPTSDCSLTGSNYACSQSATVPSVPTDYYGKYAVSEIIDLQFDRGTLGQTMSFDNLVSDPATVPEPNSLLILATGVLGAAGAFAFRRRTETQKSV